MESVTFRQQRYRGTVAIETHGCKLNLADSQLLARQFSQAGYRLVPPDAPADIYVLNTCTVTREADSKARQALRAAARRNQGAVVVATGCYAERAPQDLEQVQGTGLVVGNRTKGSLVELVSKLRGELVAPSATEGEPLYPMLPGRTRAFMKIQEGCNQVCAYCIVPRVRGRERSLSPDELVSQVQSMVEEGYQEVVLTGTQLGSYGFDLPDATLEKLLRRILAETKVPRIHLSSLQPGEMAPSLVQLWVEAPRLNPHFHMPLQSGSDTILHRMRRRYTTALYAEKVELVRRLLPDVAITTDVIVGFPGESEEEFQESLAFCERMAFAAMHVFPYSPRPGTSAAYLGGRVEEWVKERRAQAVLELAERLARGFRRSSIGTVRRVLWELPKVMDAGVLWSGLTDNYLRVYTMQRKELFNRITHALVTGQQGDALWVRVLDGHLESRGHSDYSDSPRVSPSP